MDVLERGARNRLERKRGQRDARPLVVPQTLRVQPVYAESECDDDGGEEPKVMLVLEN
jgi:hypothetical protein